MPERTEPNVDAKVLAVLRKLHDDQNASFGRMLDGDEYLRAGIADLLDIPSERDDKKLIEAVAGLKHAYGTMCASLQACVEGKADNA